MGAGPQAWVPSEATVSVPAHSGGAREKPRVLCRTDLRPASAAGGAVGEPVRQL